MLRIGRGLRGLYADKAFAFAEIADIAQTVAEINSASFGVRSASFCGQR